MQAYALGLGDIAVSSSIGKPFRASVQLIEPPADLTPDCFELKEIADSGLPLPKGLHLGIERAPNKPQRLIITSATPFYEPALAFTVSAVCEIRISRDFTLLLDFVEQIEPPQVEATPPINTPKPQASRPAVTSFEPKISAPPQLPAKADVPVARKQASKPISARKKNPVSQTKQDRLILTRSAGAVSSPAIQASPIPKPMSLDELADENTALNLKLEHLEKQLAALQKRHADLVARIQVNKPPVEKDETMNTFSYIILSLSLALFLAAAGLFYLKGKKRQVTFTEDDTDIRRIRRSSSPVLVAGMEMESMPASMDESHPPRIEPDIPESDFGSPVIHDGLTDEVEVFVAHGQHSLAIQLLEEHIHQNPLESPGPWLLLLDLLHRAGDSGKYEEIRKKCRQHFNIIVPTFDTHETNLPVTGIESYQHVLSELMKRWHTPKADAYLEALLHDNRSGKRIGFDPSAYDEILLLRDVRKLIASA